MTISGFRPPVLNPARPKARAGCSCTEPAFSSAGSGGLGHPASPPGSGSLAAADGRRPIGRRGFHGGLPRWRAVGGSPF